MTASVCWIISRVCFIAVFTSWTCTCCWPDFENFLLRGCWDWLSSSSTGLPFVLVISAGAGVDVWAVVVLMSSFSFSTVTQEVVTLVVTDEVDTEEVMLGELSAALCLFWLASIWAFFRVILWGISSIFLGASDTGMVTDNLVVDSSASDTWVLLGTETVGTWTEGWGLHEGPKTTTGFCKWKWFCGDW